jgi:hypothetical protein
MTAYLVSENYKYDEEKNLIISVSDGAEWDYVEIGVKIRIYRDRMNTWFIDVAKGLLGDGPSAGDYLVFMTCLSYIEGAEQFRQGAKTPKRESKKWFINSAKRIFPDCKDEVYERLWKEARCGLFHVGFPDGRIYLDYAFNDIPILADGDKVKINPRAFLSMVEEDFNAYVCRLEIESEMVLRQNFMTLWDELWEAS